MSVMIEESDIKAALAPSPWDLGNRVLYRLCEDYPGHTDPGVVISKIWLIGRAYAAAIERRKDKDASDTSDDFYERVVGRKLTSPKVDRWFARLPRCIDDPWKSLARCVAVHKRLTELFWEMTDLDKRSLASKYLHFHRPDLFFIYDSRAGSAIRKVTPRIDRIREIRARTSDEAYLPFCRRAQWLREDILERFGVDLTPRQLDKLLLRVSGRARQGSGI